MRVKSLYLLNFRNYRELEWEPSSALNLLQGPNAAGKTNLLEALYFVVCGHSFRTTREEEVVRWGESVARLRGRMEAAWGEITTEVWLQNRVKSLFYQGKPASRRSFPGEKMLLLFRPEDLGVVGGSPSDRRNFFNRLLERLLPGYEEVLRRYQRALEQRNALLRLPGERSQEELETWSATLVAEGTLLCQLRLRGLGMVGPLAASLYREMAGKRLVLRYSSNVVGTDKQEDLTEQFFSHLRAVEARERALGQTLVGPHRDDFLFLVEGRELRQHGSRGEARAAVLALKLAEAQLLEAAHGEKVIFLLDDVFSEFDAPRRRNLLAFLEGRQSFITSAETELRLPGRVYNVEQGQLLAADSSYFRGK
ncbi:DNA replication/repair protein RecF [Desulfothermobacter acidiphilus]|uniref:DNA replication/repair protein RecF n=1 Tax=Desulfothermobacter acidiphilus TaxID=1938353 RepID=UPI003F8A1E59